MSTSLDLHDITDADLDGAALIDRVSASPYLRAERHDELVTLRSTVTDRAVALLDVAERELTVDIPGELVGAVVDEYAGLRPTRRGVRIGLRDDAAVHTAEAVQSWRIRLQLYARQGWTASP
jgi:hypothetical protein